MLNRTEERLGHLQAHTGAQRLATVSGLNQMFPGSGVLRGLRYIFSCLVGVSKMSAQSASTCINHTVLHSFIHAFSRRFYPKRLTVHSGYTCIVSMCVPWEWNPQPLRC